MTAAAVNDPGVVTGGHRVAFAALRADTYGLRRQVTPGGSTGLQSTSAAIVGAALEALDGWAGEVHLLPPDVAIDQLDEPVALLNPDPNSRTDPAETSPEDSTGIRTSWVIYTSGTTGMPKAIRHTLHSLTRTVVRSERSAGFTWGLLYDPNRMAGLQVLLQALRSNASIVAPPVEARLSLRVQELISEHVTALSATPTLWRQILQLPKLHDWPLQQITLGGEIADQQVLNALRTRFPEARIVHVFASTETGAAFSVHDGQAGFPVEFLSSPPRGVALEVRDGILHVHSPGVSAAASDGFASTGDIVEIEGDRVLFRGRSSGVVNIGGANVWPEQVETELRSHEDVLEVTVTAKPNPLAGNMLIATVVPTPTADREGLGKRVRKWARQELPGTHVPAMVKVVDELTIAATGKKSR